MLSFQNAKENDKIQYNIDQKPIISTTKNCNFFIKNLQKKIARGKQEVPIVINKTYL